MSGTRRKMANYDLRISFSVATQKFGGSAEIIQSIHGKRKFTTERREILDAPIAQITELT